MSRLIAGRFTGGNEFNAGGKIALLICTTEQVQQRGSELVGGSSRTHIGAMSERDGPDRHRGRKRHATKLRPILEHHTGDHSDPEASLDEAQYCIHFTAFDGKPGSEAGALARRQRH
jgi:hypothetical protein